MSRALNVMNVTNPIRNRNSKIEAKFFIGVWLIIIGRYNKSYILHSVINIEVKFCVCRVVSGSKL